MFPGTPLEPGFILTDALGANLLAHARAPGEVHVPLGPNERALLATFTHPHRREEWLAGRRVSKDLLRDVLNLDPNELEILPEESGAPAVFVSGVKRTDFILNLSHTRCYAVAAVAHFAVGVDVCDDRDAERLPRIARRVFNEGEAEACDAHRSNAHRAAVWALKEAGLKLRIGGVFSPGARSVRVESLSPAQVADRTMTVALFRVPDAAIAVAREAL